MGITGWIGEGPDEQASEPQGVGGFTGFILAQRPEPGQGRTLGEVLARARQAPDRGVPEPYDDDDRQAAMVTRGYRPGLSWDLSQKLADTEAELQAEQEKIERGQRRTAQVMRMHAAGQITAFDIARMDVDEGDPGRVAVLERRADGLRRQLAEVSAMITPPQQRAPDPLEAASRRAQEALAEMGQLLAEAQAGRPERRPPFGSASRGGVAVRSEHCTWCIEFGVTDEQSYLLHSDPERRVPVTPPGIVPQAEQAEQVRQVEAEQAARAEADRLMAAGYTREVAEYAAVR